MEYKKVKYLSVLIFVLQITGFGIWFFVERPGKDYLFDTLAISLFLLGFNLVVALIFYLLKKRETLMLFLGNSVLSPLIFIAWWIIWFLYFHP